jgi:hypothetical protein
MMAVPGERQRGNGQVGQRNDQESTERNPNPKIGRLIALQTWAAQPAMKKPQTNQPPTIRTAAPAVIAFPHIPR